MNFDPAFYSFNMTPLQPNTVNNERLSSSSLPTSVSTVSSTTSKEESIQFKLLPSPCKVYKMFNYAEAPERFEKDIANKERMNSIFKAMCESLQLDEEGTLATGHSGNNIYILAADQLMLLCLQRFNGPNFLQKYSLWLKNLSEAKPYFSYRTVTFDQIKAMDTREKETPFIVQLQVDGHTVGDKPVEIYEFISKVMPIITYQASKNNLNISDGYFHCPAFQCPELKDIKFLLIEETIDVSWTDLGHHYQFYMPAHILRQKFGDYLNSIKASGELKQKFSLFINVYQK